MKERLEMMKKEKKKYLKSVEKLKVVKQKLHDIEAECTYDKCLKDEVQELRQKTNDLINTLIIQMK